MKGGSIVLVDRVIQNLWVKVEEELCCSYYIHVQLDSENIAFIKKFTEADLNLCDFIRSIWTLTYYSLFSVIKRELSGCHVATVDDFLEVQDSDFNKKGSTNKCERKLC